MSVYGIIVGKDEAHRYLEASLSWNVPLFDGVFYYDDCSGDESVEIAEAAGCMTAVRSPHAPSFMEHEGRFRQTAYNLFNILFTPVPKLDWVFSFDADEFIMSINGVPTKIAIKEAINKAVSTDAYSVRLSVPEIWGDEDGVPQRRVDGFWGAIYCTRLFRWQGVGSIRDKQMGCGSEPTYVTPATISRYTSYLCLMHYGYANRDDLVEKYQRYSTIEHGHNNNHIQSIVGEPELVPWDREVPYVYRGRQGPPDSHIGYHVG